MYPESCAVRLKAGHGAKGLFGRLPMEVLGPGQAAPHGKRLFGAVLAGQHARRQWEIGDDPEAVTPAHRNHVPFDLPVQKAPLALADGEPGELLPRRGVLGFGDLGAAQV